MSFVACSGTDPVIPDAGTPVDMGPLPDSGLRAECPVAGNNPICQGPLDCGRAGSSAPNCAFCVPRYDELCVLGQCPTIERLPATEGYTMLFNIGGFESLVDSFAGFAVAQETTGGDMLTCDDLFTAGKNYDWDNPCINIIDSRYAEASGQPAQAFPMRFGLYQEGTPALFVVYGFSGTGAMGEPVGMVCAEVPARALGGKPDETIQVDGDMMRSIQ